MLLEVEVQDMFEKVKEWFKFGLEFLKLVQK